MISGIIGSFGEAFPLVGRLLISILTLSLIFFLWQNPPGEKRQLPLPPGPGGLPLIGNSFELVREAKKGQQHLLLEQWARQHGEIVQVRVGPFVEYFLNSDKAVKVGILIYRQFRTEKFIHIVHNGRFVTGALRPLVSLHIRAPTLDRKQRADLR